MTEQTVPLGEILRCARVAAGWSLSRMGRATGYSAPYLSKLETGQKDVRPWHVDVYDRVLGDGSLRRRASLQAGSGIVPRAVWSELEIPVEAPARVDRHDVTALATSVDVLTGLGLEHGGRAAAAATRGQLRYAVGLLGGDMSGTTRVALLTTVGRLADRTAWSMADSGQLGRAGRLYDFALSLTPDPVQRCLTLVNQAHLHVDRGEPQRALALLERSEPDLPVLMFLVDALRAHAFALLGAFSESVRHVGRADAAHAAVDLTDLPAAIRPYASGHSAHAHAAGGRALAALARSGRRRAVPLAAARLEAAIDGFGPERARAIAGCRRRLDDLVG